MKIGDRVFVHGYVDEIRKDTVIIRNNGGYFGTIPSEIIKGDLVRCKDCKYGEQDDDGLWSCRDLGCSMSVDGNGFCSYGERGEADDET